MELYGDPMLSYSITMAAPLFGFIPINLKDSYSEKWRSLIGQQATPASVAYPNLKDDHRNTIAGGMVPLIDPVKEILNSHLSDEAALNQSKNHTPTGANREVLIQRLGGILNILDDTIIKANVFGLGKNFSAGKDEN